jgi:hypothetical protein
MILPFLLSQAVAAEWADDSVPMLEGKVDSALAVFQLEEKLAGMVRTLLSEIPVCDAGSLTEVLPVALDYVDVYKREISSQATGFQLNGNPDSDCRSFLFDKIKEVGGTDDEHPFSEWLLTSEDATAPNYQYPICKARVHRISETQFHIWGRRRPGFDFRVNENDELLFIGSRPSLGRDETGFVFAVDCPE